MSRVEVNEKNIRHCRCPVCPVQAKSQCTKDRNKKTDESSDLAGFNTENAAKLYCSIGKSTCPDLDSNQDCICGSCLVWDEYDLQSHYYCTKGSADEIN